MKARKKPVIVEAVQFTMNNYQEIIDFVGVDHMKKTYLKFTDLQTPVIKTLEGDMIVNNYAWIIKGVNGEFYPCQNDIFEATYDIIED